MSKRLSFILIAPVLPIVFVLSIIAIRFTVVAQDGDEGAGIGIATEDPTAPTDLPEPESIWSVAWSPDGSQIAIGTAPSHCGLNNNDYSTHIIDAITQQNIITLNPENTCPVTHLEWSPNGDNILIGTQEVGSVWQVATGHLMTIIHAIHSPNILDYDWSPDGTKIATIEDIYPYVMIFDPLGGDGLTFSNGQNPSSVAWSPDSTKLAVLGSELTIRDSTTWQTTATLPARGGGVTWSPDGNKLAGYDADNNIIVSDAQNGKVIEILSGHTDQITAIKWKSDSQTIASASADGTVRVWDIETGSQIALFSNSAPIYALDWNPDGTQLAYGGVGSSNLEIVSLSKVLTPTPTITPIP